MVKYLPNTFHGGEKMKQKIIIISIFLMISLFCMNTIYASDVLMNLNSNTSTTNSSVDNTIYSPTSSEEETMPNNAITTESSDQYDQVAVTTTDYDDSGELSISNMINIILIVVGFVLILLGIAIIIKLK